MYLTDMITVQGAWQYGLSLA